MTVSLSSLFGSSLSSASKAFNLPTIDDETQELIKSSLNSLHLVSSRISNLSLFSPNEALEDISTRDLVYLLVPFVIAQVQDRLRTDGREGRLGVLERIRSHLKSFTMQLDNYEIIPEDEVALYGTPGINPANRRELKIKQYQKQKDLRARIETIRRRRNQRSEALNTDFDLIASLLPSSADEDEEDSETDEIIRSSTLLLLRLFHAQAQTQLGNIEQELELLRNVPPDPPVDSTAGSSRQDGKSKADADMWKLDIPKANEGALLDSKGKPLQPFTILPAGAADRARLQAQVFGPGHNLPTMSIDEYLEIERERGKFIPGGGPASQNAPTSSELLSMAAEGDGTREGEENSEEKRLKDENWARFTDENPRGAGNTMNRG